MDTLQSLFPQLPTAGIHLDYLSFFTIIVLPLIGIWVLNYVIQRYIKIPKNLESPRTKTYLSATQSIITVILYSMYFFYILSRLHIDLTPFFASAGIISIIVGLGLRSILEDFFTGIFILTQDTIRVGDYVEIGSAHGITEALGFRTIHIKDQNGAVHILPNREIKKIVNYSKRQARVVVDIPIQPNQPIDRTFRALKKALEQIKNDKVMGKLLSEGSGVQGIEQIGAGKIIVRVLLLTRPAFRWDIARQYRYLALQQLEKAKVTLA